MDRFSFVGIFWEETYGLYARCILGRAKRVGLVRNVGVFEIGSFAEVRAPFLLPH